MSTIAGPATGLRTALSPSVAALPASTTVLGAAEIARLPVQSYGDLFRPIAGFDVSNYGQGGVGYGIALRGFSDAEHGRDVAVFVDGVPINEVSSIHTPNYVDLNPLIPETIRSIGIVRGPFSVEAGDAGLGGAIFIETKRAEPLSTVGVSGGSFETLRGLATFSQVGPGLQPFLAYEGYGQGGYRQNGDLGRYNAFNKVTIPLDTGSSLSVRVQMYGTSFGQPGYLERDLVRAGLVSPRAATNVTDGGGKTLQTVVANYLSGPPEDELSALLYASHDQTSRFSDFGGGQRGQVQERATVGGRLRRVWTTNLFDVLPTQVLAGADWRSDALDVITGPSVARGFTGRSLDLDILQHDLGAYAQVQVKPTPWLKLTGGARADQFLYDVRNALDPALSPAVSPHIVSPKGGAALTPFDWLELFANYGQGFRSPSASSELVGNPRLTPFSVESTEGGGRLIFDRVSLLGTVFFTDISNEVFQAAPGLPVQNLGRSRRDGFEIEGKLLAWRDGLDRVSLFASTSAVSARLLNGATSIFVPNVPASLATVGAEFDLGEPVTPFGPGRVTGAAYLSYIGAKPLTEDGLLRSRPYTRVSGRLAYVHASGWTTYGQATWYPGDRTSESIFNFGPTLAAAASDIFTSPQPRLTLLAGVTYGFATGASAP
ncbi:MULTISPECIES: TonB-dependent receptor [Methylobacterium]|uniref:TonB-dependent receptor n=1 Tax=Methylobacterium TaxID=407 RepID=UPI000EED7D9E|nr:MULTISPECIES: TonB-dependent receptor [Methylobacterium]GBU18180.1 TonB-dependent receptor [Methylobacterium sp.]